MSEHQNEREELGVLSADDGHASGADESRDRDEGRGAEVEPALGARGRREAREYARSEKETTLRMRTMLPFPAPTAAEVCAAAVRRADMSKARKEPVDHWARTI